MKSKVTLVRLSNTLLYIICVALGSILGVFFCNYSYFTFDKSISYFDLLSLTVTTGVGVWIAVRLGKALSQQNAEKTLLIEEVKEVLKKQDAFNSAIEKKVYDLDIKADFKNVNERLILLGTILKESHCKSLSVDEIHVHRKKLRRIMTNAAVANNQFNLSLPEYSQAKSAANLFKQECFHLIFEINKK